MRKEATAPPGQKYGYGRVLSMNTGTPARRGAHRLIEGIVVFAVPPTELAEPTSATATLASLPSHRIGRRSLRRLVPKITNLVA